LAKLRLKQGGNGANQRQQVPSLFGIYVGHAEPMRLWHYQEVALDNRRDISNNYKVVARQDQSSDLRHAERSEEGIRSLVNELVAKVTSLL
jgi:electron transfer flavoprotein alpha/beta subunit